MLILQSFSVGLCKYILAKFQSETLFMNFRMRYLLHLTTKNISQNQFLLITKHFKCIFSVRRHNFHYISFLSRREILLHLAREHSYNQIMLGNTSTSLSASILTNIAKGRGAAVPLEMAFSDGRHGDVVFVRPMRYVLESTIC